MGEKAIIRLGDKTSHNGTVLEGYQDNICMGKPIAGVGHKVSCPKCPGTHTIVEGARIFFVLGVNVAVEGMKTSCGAVLVASQQTDTAEAGGGGGGGGNAATAAAVAAAAVPAATSAAPAAAPTAAAPVAQGSPAAPAEGLLCTITIVPNEQGDNLPIIQKASRTQNNKVLYHLKLKAKLVQQADGKPAPGQALALASSRAGDKLTMPPKSDAGGELEFTIDTREKGEAVITTTTDGVTLAEFKVTFKEAWYEATFKITGYNVCDEADFDGKLVDGGGLDEQHKEDFLFGAAGVPMQGTGKTTEGRYIRLDAFGGGWHRNARGNRDYVNTQASVTFKYADGVIGSFNPVSVNHSIAVDPTVIPKKGKVNIEAVGDRYADDRGSAILGYHIDNFLGAGKAVVTAWTTGEVNGTQRRVKYLGE